MHLLTLLLIAVATGAAQATSFDCKRARLAVEKMICASETLSNLDDDLAIAYANRAHSRNDEELRQSQREWLKTRDSCPNSTCVTESYHKRLWKLAASREGDLPGSPVSVSCDPKRSTLTFVEGAEPNSLFLLQPEQVMLGSLLSYEEGTRPGHPLGKTEVVEHKCRLGTSEYQASLSAWMMTYDAMGQCGAGAPALGLAITRNGRALLPGDFTFSGNCHNAGSIKYMVFSEGAQTVVVGYFAEQFDESADLLVKLIPMQRLKSVLAGSEREAFLLGK